MPKCWTHPPVFPTDAVTAANDASLFFPFSPEKLDDSLDKLALTLRYQVKAGRTAELWAPAAGKVSFLTRREPGGAVSSRTLILTLGPSAIEMLRLGGREPDDLLPLEAQRSSLPRGALDTYYAPFGEAILGMRGASARRLEARLLFTIRSEDVDRDLRKRLVDLFAAGALQRQGLDDYDVRLVDGRYALVPLSPGPPEERYLAPWWDGLSADAWEFQANDSNAKLAELGAGKCVEVHAQVSGGYSPHQWYACNAGFLLRALGAAGDPAHIDNDEAYIALAGGREAALALVGSGVDVTSSPGNEEPAPTLDEIIVVHCGSKDGVFLNPPPDGCVPASLFSFTTADDVRIYSRRLGRDSLQVRLWQPTYHASDLQRVRSQVRALGGNASDIKLPLSSNAILTSEYETKYPRKIDREQFFDVMESAFGYDGRRALPSDNESGFPVSVPSIPEVAEVTLNLNSFPELRPEHPPWRKQRSGQMRRLFPLILDGMFGEGGAPAFILSQDEVDCVRQEYEFHMRWTPDSYPGQGIPHFYQTYEDVWTAGQRQVRILPNDSDPMHVGKDPNTGESLRPAIGYTPLLTVPNRADVRPIRERREQMEPWAENLASGEGNTRYRYTMRVQNSPALRQEVSAETGTCIEDILALLASLEGGGVAPSFASLPEYGQQVVKRIYRILTRSDLGSVEDFLHALLTDPDALNGIRELDKDNALNPVFSGWRPPEHNECVSKTPISRHQLGAAMEFSIVRKDKRRNPLGMLALHTAAQTFMSSLHELLLERNADEYFLSLIDPTKFEHVIVANPKIGGGFDYVLLQPSDPATQIPIDEPVSIAGEPVKPTTRLHVTAVKAFHTAYNLYVPTPAPWPRPTYQDLYIFALCEGSHVHFTWKRPPAM